MGEVAEFEYEYDIELPPLDEGYLLPPYLRDMGEATHTYGELSYNARSKAWVINGEDAVCQLAKRLFPGCEGRTRRMARFSLNRRSVGDLHWLMLRYPLRIRERDRLRWQTALEGARRASIQKELSRSAPQALAPSPADFAGELLPFQEQGVAFLVNNPHSLLADEMGLGKTVEALGYLSITKAFPAIIIAPAHLSHNWEMEIARFLRNADGSPVTTHIVRGLTPYELPEVQIVIMHYLLLRGWKQVLPKLPFKCVVFDEIQELRHAGTEKYSAASLLSSSCENVFGLSGTPIYNRGGEIWNVINILDFHALGDWESFSRQWCYGYGRDIVIHPDRLGEHLREEGLIFRRTKDQVLEELPPKRRLVTEIDFDDNVYKGIMAGVEDLIYQYRQATRGDRLANLEELIAQRERQATGLAKAPFVVGFVRALLEAGEKVLLFAHHHSVMDAYRAALKSYNPYFVTGRETQKGKQAAVDAFMNGESDLLCISMRACTGLNLQRASCVVFGELDWSPAVHTQAEDRAHRINQRDSVLCYYLTSPKGSDREMQESLGLKVSQFTQLMGDEAQAPDVLFRQQTEAREHMRHVVERLSQDIPIAP